MLAAVLWLLVSNVVGLRDVDLEVVGMAGRYITGCSIEICGLVVVISVNILINNRE